MKEERKVLIDEIRAQDKKLQLIAKPFGGYINILDVDDVHFEDAMIPVGVKQALAVSTFEEKINQRFNLVGGSLGLRETKWGRAAIILFGLWTAITCIVCFEKADFLNVSNFLVNSVAYTRNDRPVLASGSLSSKVILPASADLRPPSK